MNTADGANLSPIVLEYAPAPERRRLYSRLLSLSLLLVIAAGTGTLAYALTPTRYVCSAVLDVKHAEPSGFACFGPVRKSYSAQEQKELEWVRRAACETARSATFRRTVTEGIVEMGVERRDALALARGFRVEPIAASRMIRISVVDRDRTLSRRTTELVLVHLVGRHGKVVIDPIQVAAATAGQKAPGPALIAMGLALLFHAAKSTGLIRGRAANPHRVRH